MFGRTLCQSLLGLSDCCTALNSSDEEEKFSTSFSMTISIVVINTVIITVTVTYTNFNASKYR